MEPQPAISRYVDDSVPFGLLITIVLISDQMAQRIRMLPGEPFSGCEPLPESLQHLGQVYVTSEAKRAIPGWDLALALEYHLRGESKAAAPDDPTLHFRDALRGRHFLAAYRSSRGRTFWIVTQADRSRTMVLTLDEAESLGL